MIKSAALSGKPNKALRKHTWYDSFGDIFISIDLGRLKTTLTSKNIDFTYGADTLLQYVIGFDYVDEVSWLLKYPNNINALSGYIYKYTALHYTLFNGQVDYFRLLLFYGADPNIKDSLGLSVNDYLDFNRVTLQDIVDNPIMVPSLAWTRLTFSDDEYEEALTGDKSKFYHYVTNVFKHSSMNNFKKWIKDRDSMRTVMNNVNRLIYEGKKEEAALEILRVVGMIKNYSRPCLFYERVYAGHCLYLYRKAYNLLDEKVKKNADDYLTMLKINEDWLETTLPTDPDDAKVLKAGDHQRIHGECIKILEKLLTFQPDLRAKLKDKLKMYYGYVYRGRNDKLYLEKMSEFCL